MKYKAFFIIFEVLSFVEKTKIVGTSFKERWNRISLKNLTLAQNGSEMRFFNV